MENNDLSTKKHMLHSKAKYELRLELLIPCLPSINAENSDLALLQIS